MGPHAIMRMGLAGRTVTDYLIRIIAERGYMFTTTAEREMVRDIKEKLGYVALDYDAEIAKEKESPSEFEKHYEMPDGHVLTFGNERFRCAEVLFKPSFIGSSQEGLHNVVYNCIMRNDFHAQQNLSKNIVLAGGCSMFPGMGKRIHKELKLMANRNWRITAQPERKYSSWIGGSILSSLSTFEEMWITKEEYQDVGPSIVHRKCT